MRRLWLAVLTAALAGRASSQVRAVSEAAPSLVSPLSALGGTFSAALGPSSALATTPALSAAAPLSASARAPLSAPLAAPLAAPAALPPAAAVSALAAPAASAFAPAAAIAAAPMDAFIPAQAAAAASAAAPLQLTFPKGPDGKPLVLRSLKDLALLLGDGAKLAGARTFDGEASREVLVDPSGLTPTIPAGVTSVDAHPLRSGSDVDLIPATGNSLELHDELRTHLSSLMPLDIFVYHDAKGGRFLGLDLSRNPDNVERLPELQAHEVATIRRIQTVTRDLQVLVREEGAAPDLVVGGVPTEMKSVFRGDVALQVAHANVQLLAHARRHGLGAGAIALDILGRGEVPVERVEEGIAQAVRLAAETAFDRVYAFNAGAWQTYARGQDGAFRLDRAARPFVGPAHPSSTRAAFVPQTLARAHLPNLDVVEREITEPARLLRARGVEATVSVYGSARILSPDAAHAQLLAVQAEVGTQPKSSAGKRRLMFAREAVRMSKYYQIARELGALVAGEGRGKVAIVTGGGPGIMEAANRGAFEAGGPSAGFNITLPHEQNPNPYATKGLEFTFENFATRKMALRHGAMGLVYFPGGFGTMDELFEVLTLMQTGKMPRTPIVLIGERAYWDRILDFDEFARMGLIAPNDLSMFSFAENAPQAWSAIQRFHAAPPALPASAVASRP